MPKKKLARFAEMETFSNVLQPEFKDIFGINHALKGKWSGQIFGNNHPLTLELGCGKGEFTVGLARKYPQLNFIGVDIKGARIWRGARTALEENIGNAAFLRTRIEFSGSFFESDEISEIWITFPDPQPKKKRKRLTSPFFLNLYRSFLKNNGRVHLKTDNEDLYNYTRKVVVFNHLLLEFETDDLYAANAGCEAAQIQTFYENQYLEMGKKINYLRFLLPSGTKILEPPEDE
ncbi:MAG: tRNA (guanosine(46)-N7)-methyltransferase TrmB [Bacteroidales bacterium]|nr:tRNA (guanosine(46)-N7)-methyltransferase TrmB [Bacteroidales bacterium]